jgi:hypothetical protein
LGTIFLAEYLSAICVLTVKISIFIFDKNNFVFPDHGNSACSLISLI